jgi:hypothetical protein
MINKSYTKHTCKKNMKFLHVSAIVYVPYAHTLFLFSIRITYTIKEICLYRKFSFISILNYLIPWSRVILQKLLVTELFKKFPTFYAFFCKTKKLKVPENMYYMLKGRLCEPVSAFLQLPMWHLPRIHCLAGLWRLIWSWAGDYSIANKTAVLT